MVPLKGDISFPKEGNTALVACAAIRRTVSPIWAVAAILSRHLGCPVARDVARVQDYFAKTTAGYRTYSCKDVLNPNGFVPKGDVYRLEEDLNDKQRLVAESEEPNAVLKANYAMVTGGPEALQRAKRADF